MNLALKICGMRNSENISEVAALQPEYMGFIFYDQSPRFVGNDFNVPRDLPSTIKRVGVFVQQSTPAIIALVAKHKLDYVQLHGNESLEQCEEIQSKTIRVIKVFSVDADFDFNSVKPFMSCADYFLFDTKGKYYGGNAVAFDWSLLHKYNQDKPFFLSGGISAAHVPGIQKLRGMNIHALDVNSGVETAPAIKDILKTAELKRMLNDTV